MTTNRIAIMPGVSLHMVQTERFKTGCFSINLLRPLAMEDAAPNALIPSVLLRGCRDYPDMRAISQRLDELYGASAGTLIRKKGEVQTVGLYLDFLEDRYAGGEPVFTQMLDFLRQLLFSPCQANGGFLDAYVEGETLNLSNAIAARINDKRGYAISRLMKQMCAGEPYAVPRLGEAETLEAVTPQNLLDRWNRLLATSRIELFYLGQQPEAAVVQAVRELLRDLPREALTAVGTVPRQPDRSVQYIQEAMDVTQGKLTLGFRTEITVHDPRYSALMLLNAVYGAGTTSKLFLKIREEQSLCYYASSTADKFKGVVLVDSGIACTDYQVALDGILEQLSCCQRGEITEEELESARTYLISALRTGQDSPGRLDDFAVGQAIAGLEGTMTDLAEQLSRVTRDQVVEAANSLRLDTVYFLKGAEA